MDPDRDDELFDRCADCGAEIPGTGARSFSAGAESVLCFECAVRRGGSYDELHDRWEVAPDASGLEREPE